ncbi:histone-lysine N-methyltransferase ASH1L-like isoform X1 [Syngnathus typhle]|uniref:histone-lysine N-methyltransferase ASH1L-like isoform X1 n=1 Tax=Syngnathus typhle TaxID=161592 RepID=UPI002A6A13CE|nr:histone-lysine N-methyltransferase ASH1L-like isoform X1 [Syngnathus typhle]XP_061144652.1 histone-lysine N-methyltransferase ASH1L-like isoform X1 [Syngnathus typhle]XP_061144653.1 histone-lysine N-methyltransferase ASH1L-like isoform X1 [Syngnathus typhle]XP_061144654.1 histone-lysine N-methyltransferase ASH1L-like isoform X1 [Syngnathus typhle]XP_061144655.1 histone-lysine N-methyltransferase ASH1L-like isoform X1 [Syngnathus typhle]
MDQRMKGDSPLMTDSALDASTVPEDFEQDQEKRKRVETDDSDVGKKEDKRGKKREGDKGAVLELLIEGRCGGAGQICGRETSCPDGNVRLRIGVQAKRTKKPPKILESYVCKPTIRTYQRQQGRGCALPTRTAAADPVDASRENRSGSDVTQTASSATAQSLTPANATVPAVASVQPGPKQVPLKLAGITEAAGSSEKAKKEKIHEQSLKTCSSTSDQEASAALSGPGAETGREIVKKHNGVVHSKKGLCAEDKLRDVKTVKHSSSVCPSPGSSKTETCNSALDMSPAGSQVQETSLKRSNDKKRAKERKLKKDKRKERKPKGDRLEAERGTSDDRKDEIKKKKKVKDGKVRQGKDGHELKIGEKADKSKMSLEKQRKEDMCSGGGAKCDQPYQVADQGRSDEGKQAEPQATIADSGNDIIRSPPALSSGPPPLSPPSSCPEQDSRPLKKRKARRPSWTKLVHRAHRVENQEADSPSFSPKLPTHSTPSSSVSFTAKASSPEHNPNVSIPKQSARKRGRPKSRTMIFTDPPLRLSPEEVAFLECDDIQKSPVLDRSPKKRGRPRKQPLRKTDDTEKNGDPPRQLKIRRLINEMKKRKKKRLHKVMMSSNAGDENKRVPAFATSHRTYRPIEPPTVPTLSDLSSSFGTKLGPQINVSKRGTIYMGKRRGRKPKSQTARLNSHSYAQSSLFGQPTETSLFVSNQPPVAPHPFPSPSLTHSSGAQSPYSEGSVTEPSSALLFPPPFSLPSPSSSCTSPRPPSSSSLSPFVKKSCPCQGRQHFPFHQSSCKLSSTGAPLHPAPGSPGHLKDATPSPRSESHSEETLPSDSGIGTDNNSVCERAEMRGVRGMLRLGQGSGGILGGPKLSSLADPLVTRHKNPTVNPTSAERHRHRHRRRDYSCPSSCNCLCPCSGHNKCTHSDYFPRIAHNAPKRAKTKHKKKHQQLLRQDPEFLSELEELIGQFGQVHIGRRGWTRSELNRAFDGGRRHHPSHSHRSNIFRINLNGFYSPHHSTYAANPSFPAQSFYPCQTLHCNRKPERRQCGCPSKFQETVDNVGFYSGYPPATTLYHHLPGSYPLPSPHQFASQQHHHAHLLLNPARFHRRRNRLLRDGTLGGDIEGNLSYPCDCGHKHKHRQRLCERNVEDEAALEHQQETRETFSTSKSRFILGQGGGWKGTKGIGGVRSKESPWLREKANNSFSAAASSSSLAERSKHASLFSVGLGSSHLSSFGGGWGALGQSWTKLRGAGFPNTSWGSSAGRTGPMIPSDPDDEDDGHHPHPSRTPPSPTHTNLFTSVDVATGGRGLRSESANRNLGSADSLWRTDEPAWTERRDAAFQGDPRSRGQLRGVPKTHGADEKNKRRPGRPRKRPLPSALPPTVSSLDLARGRNGDAGGRLSDLDGAAVSAVRQVTDPEPRAKRKQGRKRKHAASPCRQSVAEDETGRLDAPAEQAASRPAAVQRDKSEDGPPRKPFLKAGLYSDDYKTTDPPSQSPLFSRGSAEYKPGECSLLPAPIHVGKYLRMKRIHFQLPYDVMWLWQHNQLQRQPAFPLKRKRRYCRLKERIFPSQHAAEENSGDLASLFPHLDMEPLSSDERSFVVTHRVFLVRNWELVRERQIRLRTEGRREGDSEAEDWHAVCADGAGGDDSYIKSDVPVGVAEVTISSSDPHPASDDTPRSLTASPRPTESRNREDDDDEEEEDKAGECSREQRRKRLNDLLLTLQHS